MLATRHIILCHLKVHIGANYTIAPFTFNPFLYPPFKDSLSAIGSLSAQKNARLFKGEHD